MTYDSARHPSDFTRDALVTEAALSRNTDLMEALLAACAIIAHADGEMAAAERRRLFSLVRENAALSVFSREEVVEEVAVHEANYRLDPELAHLMAREKLMQVVGQKRLCRIVVGACREIIPADGIAHPSEYRALAEIRHCLGLDDAPGALPSGESPAASRPPERSA